MQVSPRSLPFVVALLALSCDRGDPPPRASKVQRALTLPAGFQDELIVGGLSQPTAVRFARDGRIFVAEKSGLVKVLDPRANNDVSVFADLRTNVHNYWDRGLLDLELHPNFPETPHVYVLYTFDGLPGGTAPRWGRAGATSDACPSPPGPTENGCVVAGRLSRLTAEGNRMKGVEEVLVENWLQQFPSHSVGALAFGPDGMLYVTGGDGASFGFADHGQAGQPSNPLGDPPAPVGGVQAPPTARGGAVRAQNAFVAGFPVTFAGKVLRLDPATGRAAPGNPLGGGASPGAEPIVAQGLRNPFRLAFRPGTRELWVADVGWSAWEEINRLPDPTAPAVTNFGWPCYEGAARQPAYESLNLDACRAVYDSGAHAAPHYAYRHDEAVVAGDGCGAGQGAITGLAFYPGGGYPEEYRGALFFADYARGCIWALMPDASGLPNPANRRVVVQAAETPVQLTIGPGNDLYYLSHGGSLHRVSAIGDNAPPVAAVQASATSGPVPLAVTFDARGSADPDAGDTLTFRWDLDGDGQFDDGSAETATFVYGAAGERQVGLKVIDSRGAVGTTFVTVTSGQGSGPEPFVSVDAAAFDVGQVVHFQGGARVDGRLVPAANLRWDLVVQHCPTEHHCHPHLVESFAGVDAGTFVAPDHEYPYYLELVLRATGDDGRQNTAVTQLDPRTVDLTVTSSPPGIPLALNQRVAPTPFSVTVAVGSTNTVTAQNVAGFDFQSWSDGGARSHLVVAPATPTTLTAQYRVLEGAVQLKHLGSVIARVQEPQGLGSHDLEVIRNDDRPPPGTVDGARQYDTFTTDLAPKDEWVGYELGAPHLFSRVVFQEGGSFPDGGWFEKIEVQVRKGGIWTPVEGVTVTPAYPGAGDGVWFDSYRFDFPPTSGDAIRLHGPAGGAAHFVSIGELDVFGRAVIPGQDLPPFAQAAGPDPVLAGEEVTLDGRGSSDPEGNALTFAWKQTGGPPVSLSDAASARPRFCAPDVKTATTLTFSLTVGDGKQSSAPVTLTLQLLPFLGPMDLTPRGRILISERLPRGLGSRDVEVIRDGITPAPGAQDWLAQYDTAAGDPGVTEGYVGYELDKAYRFSKLVFQEGGRFADGGWFDRLRVQVRQDGRWYEVPGLAVAPAYPASGGAAGFATYTFTFTPTVGDAIRLFGAPGGAMRFFSVAELRMFMAPPAGPNAPPVANAGRDFALPEGVQARLDGARSFDPDGRTITTKWRQTYGPRVSLADASSATPSFTAPEVSARTTLEFRLDVADDRSVAYDAVVVTVEPATAPRDVTAAGVVIASVRAPLGGGSRDLEILRDGVTPAAGTEDGSLQYDTFTATPASSAWFGYELDVARALGKIVFQEGLHFGDGGWFTSLAVQVRRDGSWAPVAGVVVSPSYPGANDGRGFDTYTLTFPPVVAEAIRIVGPPDGAATFVSVAELRVFMP